MTESVTLKDTLLLTTGNESQSQQPEAVHNDSQQDKA